jgi:hypothetical protein
MTSPGQLRQVSQWVCLWAPDGSVPGPEAEQLGCLPRGQAVEDRRLDDGQQLG